MIMFVGAIHHPDVDRLSGTQPRAATRRAVRHQPPVICDAPTSYSDLETAVWARTAPRPDDAEWAAAA